MAKKSVKKAPAKASKGLDVASIKAIPKKITKSETFSLLADETGLSKKQVASVLRGLGEIIVAHMKKRGSGEFTIPETGIRVKRKTRPATKKRLGRNPATGEQIWIAAKPARTVVKIIPLRALKESVVA